MSLESSLSHSLSEPFGTAATTCKQLHLPVSALIGSSSEREKPLNTARFNTCCTYHIPLHLAMLLGFVLVCNTKLMLPTGAPLVIVNSRNPYCMRVSASQPICLGQSGVISYAPHIPKLATSMPSLYRRDK